MSERRTFVTAEDWDGYAAAVPHSDAFFDAEPVQLARAEAIARRATGTVLDVGSAEGHVAEMMDGPVTLVDISPVRVQKARTAGRNAQVGDATSLDFEDDSFDTVVLGEILEHLDDPGQALAEAFRVAKDRVVISLPLNGWEDISHQWRISFDECLDLDQMGREPTKGHQIVLTFQRGACWPPRYWKDDESWKQQFEEGR